MLFDVRSAVRSSTGLAAVIALVLVVAACGRRGPLEAPPDASATAKPSGAKTSDAKATTPATRRVAAPAPPTNIGGPTQAGTLDTPDDETEEAAADPSDAVILTPTPAAPGARKRGHAYQVPKEPFVLDPLL